MTGMTPLAMSKVANCRSGDGDGGVRGRSLLHLKPEAAMDDRVEKLFAGHMGVSAVLANILIEKNVVSREEAIFRFREAHDAATKCSGGIEVAHALAAMVSYLSDG